VAKSVEVVVVEIVVVVVGSGLLVGEVEELVPVSVVVHADETSAKPKRA